jgi:excisionase family DNA binding protein
LVGDAARLSFIKVAHFFDHSPSKTSKLCIYKNVNPMITNPTKWLTKKVAAMHLKLSVRSIENLIKKQILQAHRIGGRVLLHLDELDQVVFGNRMPGIHNNKSNDRL